MSESVVYIIGVSTIAPVKIGTTASISTRLAEIERVKADRYDVMRIVPGGRSVETWLHNRFAASRIQGEWFEYDPDMLTVTVPTSDEIARQTDESTYAGLAIAFLRRHYGTKRDAASVIAADAKCTPRAAKEWLVGSHAPNGEKLINLMAANLELADKINRLVAERRAERGVK